MYHRYNSKKANSGVTLVEIMVASAILAFIGGVVGHWFFLQREYQGRIFAITDAQQTIRKASWQMIQELRTARNVVFPRINSDKSLRSDSKVVFKNFSGDIISFYYDESEREIRRCRVPNGPGVAEIDKEPIATNVDQIIFTASDDGNRLIDIFMSINGTYGLESVYLMNE
jgi:prepilin-type N-terminal cleavage/methylation domain-containing protein